MSVIIGVETPILAAQRALFADAQPINPKPLRWIEAQATRTFDAPPWIKRLKSESPISVWSVGC